MRKDSRRSQWTANSRNASRRNSKRRRASSWRNRHEGLREGYWACRKSKTKISVHLQVLCHRLHTGCLEESKEHGIHTLAYRSAGECGQTERHLFPGDERARFWREDHMGLFLSHSWNRIPEPSVEDGLEPSADTSQERRPVGCPPLPGTTLILDRQHELLPTQADRWDMLLDRDSTKAVNAEDWHHGGHKCPWREGPNETLQRTEQVCGWYLRTAEVQENAIRENQNPQKYVVHSGANENRKTLDSKKNLYRGVKLGLKFSWAPYFRGLHRSLRGQN